jgi:hypothetical protein
LKTRLFRLSHTKSRDPRNKTTARRQLGIESETVKELIEKGWLHAKEAKPGELLIEKSELRQFKNYAIFDGLKLRCFIPHSHKPISNRDYADVYRLLEKVEEKNLPVTLKKIGDKLCLRYGIKRGNKK